MSTLCLCFELWCAKWNISKQRRHWLKERGNLAISPVENEKRQTKLKSRAGPARQGINYLSALPLRLHDGAIKGWWRSGHRDCTCLFVAIQKHCSWIPKGQRHQLLIFWKNRTKKIPKNQTNQLIPVKIIRVASLSLLKKITKAIQNNHQNIQKTNKAKWDLKHLEIPVILITMVKSAPLILRKHMKQTRDSSYSTHCL